jgi:peptidoglycan/LPS O-acetylase OafA/YrhL
MALAASLTQVPKAGRQLIPGLDGIRALAVLTVFVFHAEILPHIPGELATTIFFFLSGFLITTLFLKEWKKTGEINLGSFYFRRALRTLPPLYIVLAIALVASRFLHVGEPMVTWKAMGNVFQYTNYAVALPRDTAGFLPGMVLLWSLAVDEHYYLLYAPIMKAALNKVSVRKIILAMVGLCGLALMWRFYLVHVEGFASYRVSMASDTRMDSILFGAILAFWRNPALNPEKAASLAKPLPVALGCIGLLLPTLSGSDVFKTTIGYTIEGIALMPLFSLAILHSSKGALKFLNSPVLLWISRASYPIYLFQWLTLIACRQYIHGPKLVQVGCAFIVTFALAAALHYSVERPLMALRKRTKNREVPEATTVRQRAEPIPA